MHLKTGGDTEEYRGCKHVYALTVAVFLSDMILHPSFMEPSISSEADSFSDSQNIHAFHGTRLFSTVYTRADH